MRPTKTGGPIADGSLTATIVTTETTADTSRGLFPRSRVGAAFGATAMAGDDGIALRAIGPPISVGS